MGQVSLGKDFVENCFVAPSHLEGARTEEAIVEQLKPS